MRAVAWTVVAVGALLVLGALALVVVAIWTVGENSERYAFTAFFLGSVGSVAAFGGAAWLDLDRFSR